MSRDPLEEEQRELRNQAILQSVLIALGTAALLAAAVQEHRGSLLIAASATLLVLCLAAVVALVFTR